MFAICDSGWVPVYLRWIYGIDRKQYCGPMIFKDLVAQGKHRMIFMGTNQQTLDSLQQELAKMNPDVMGPLATPPESKAMAVYTGGTNRLRASEMK